MSKQTKRIAVGITAVLVILGLAIGGKMFMDKKAHNQNLEYQRQAALTLKKEEPRATKVVFKGEGSSDGIGLPWSIDADVTVNGQVFVMGLERNRIGIVFGDKYEPSKNTDVSDSPLEVIYGNGEREIIK
ncbi:MAG TPA: hypothetical protein DCZ00_07500 [Lactococcus sp.]|uniref:Secreted protein n=1 Tax=Lactococcus muris TaxID=2941330 RepID=A0ABV4DBS0_9LACT|nr:MULTISPECIES: hypothetical protein [Lactococcus]HAP14633.1 hypothetical protein [Lactococcus sp.]HBC91271.1 hypothetical protein [Lactococcus sp.]